MEQRKRLTGYVLVDPADGAVLCHYSADGDIISAKMEAIHDAEERGMEVYGCIDSVYSDGTRIYPRC